MTALRMLDLFSGSGGASRAAAVRGWEVVRIDNAEGTAADIRADLGSWMPAENDRYDLVWASPPCTQLSTAGARRDVASGLVLVDAALRIIRTLSPRWWVLENVHGATRAIGSRIGPPVACYGSFYLWGVFPPFEAVVPREKTKLSGRRRAERRAAIPWAISDGLVRACEKLAKEIPFSAPPSSPEVPPSSPRVSSVGRVSLGDLLRSQPFDLGDALKVLTNRARDETLLDYCGICHGLRESPVHRGPWGVDGHHIFAPAGSLDGDGTRTCSTCGEKVYSRSRAEPFVCSICVRRDTAPLTEEVKR